jgi:hypothetical protein
MKRATGLSTHASIAHNPKFSPLGKERYSFFDSATV